MTRAETLAAYRLNAGGGIATPGKFEGEAVYVPAMWEASGDGSCDILDWPEGTESYVLDITPEDRAEWPEIGAETVALHMQESEQGFVSCEELTQSELDALRAENDSAWEAEPDEEDSDLDPDPMRAARDWHDGQDSAFYAIACNGRIPSLDIAEAAESECDRLLALNAGTPSDKADLEALRDECIAYRRERGAD